MKKNLVSFGEYLLSSKRTERIKSTISNIPLEDRLKAVYHADMENWKEMNK